MGSNNPWSDSDMEDIDHNSDYDSPSFYETSDSDSDSTMTTHHDYDDDDDDSMEFDIMTNLTGFNRDYLIRNNGDHVKVESLGGKTILFFKIPCLPLTDYLDFFSNQLVVMYHELKKKKHNFGFEVVLLVQTCNQASFDEFFSNNHNIPFLAIPFEDSQSRARVLRLLDLDSDNQQVIQIINPSGRFSPCDKLDIMAHGVEAYPFTFERCKQIGNEYDATLRSRSLEKLLASPTRDYVLSIGDHSKRVPISDLKGKLVALYLCLSHHILRQVKNVYQQCRAQGLEFEVVLIYVNFEISLQDYQDFVKDELGDGVMANWLALPFRDKTCSKLSQLFICPFDKLVVVGPDGNFLDEYAGEVICEYGIDAYPFTREKVFHNEKARLDSLTLESLLVYGGRDYVINKDGVRFPIHSLKGRNVFLYLADDDDSPPTGELYRRLMKWYAAIKARDDAFEVVYVSRNTNKFSFQSCVSAMPWKALPYDLKHSDFVARKTWNKYTTCAIAAFGSNGRLLTKNADQHLKRQGCSVYPLTHVNLMEEIQQHFALEHRWPASV